MNGRITTSAWQALERHARDMGEVHMRDLFANDPTRFDAFSVSDCGILLDYSKNCITAETIDLLLALARGADVEGWRAQMFEGAEINATEHRAVLHTALRAPQGTTVTVAGENIMPKVHDVRARMRTLVEDIRSGAHGGATGLEITDVVTIGIGGSLLGPEMAVDALSPFRAPGLKMHFVSALDRDVMDRLLAGLSWETTLFIIGSKTFTTQETMINANAARDWFLGQEPTPADMSYHFIAVTASPERAQEFGISPESTFEMWDWVGGRYSLWSAVGLPIALAIGMDGFEDLLAGARAMDQHFLNTPLEQNMPVLLGLLGIWHINLMGAQTHAIVPYTELLRGFPAYLQQLDMESNGKGVGLDGVPVDHATAPVIWGGVGTGVQHSFFQRLHQGPEMVPVDFIAATKPSVAIDPRNAALLANCFAQSESLMGGKTEDEVRAEMAAQGMDGAEIELLAPHRAFPGNRPSNTLLLRWLDPKTLGALIALYEHKVFVQGVLWNIDSFDQWGVELGKTAAQNITGALEGKVPDTDFDASTAGLIQAARGVKAIEA